MEEYFMKIKLQPYEEKFFNNLKSMLPFISDEDAEQLFRVWRRNFGCRRDKATALRLLENPLKQISYFEQHNFIIFIQNGKWKKSFNELNSDMPFLAIECLYGFTNDLGAPLYSLQAYNPN